MEKRLWDGKVIRAGIVKTGAGFYLDQADLKVSSSFMTLLYQKISKVF